MSENELIELGVCIEEVKVGLEDVCVYLKRFKKDDDLAVSELILENVKAMKVRFASWASLKFGLGLNDAVLEAVRRKHFIVN